MYFIYDRSVVGGYYRYSSPRETHLFGCNIGLIVRYLKNHLPKGPEECGPWKMDIGAAIQEIERCRGSFIIHLNPVDPKDVSLHELLRVWGYSLKGWTPLMLETVPVVDCPGAEVAIADFQIAQSDYEDLDKVYSFLYVKGTIRNGVLENGWTPPRPSSTNGPVLYPYALEYFMSEIGFARIKAAKGR